MTAQVAEIAAQIGSSLMPDTGTHFNRFTVESQTSSKVYVVSQRRSSGGWECGCQGWTRWRHCKHLADILSRLAELPTVPTFDPSVHDMLASARTAYLDLGPARAVKHHTVVNRQIEL